MKAQINVVSGGPAGTVHVFSKSEVCFGRHPDCDLQFDPQDDLQVSVRHALLIRSGDKWSLRDLESSNGTFLNGHQITAETQLDNTDQIRFGRNGPLLEFRLVHEGTVDTDKARAAMPVTAGHSPRPTDTGERAPVSVRKSSTEQRVKVEVAKQTRKLRTGLFLLAFVLAGVLGAATYITGQQRKQLDSQVADLQARIDSVLIASDVTIRDLRGEVNGLAEALQQSRIEMRDLTNQLGEARASGNTAQITTLTARLVTLQSQLSSQQSAARIDYVGIRAANQRAVGIVRVHLEDGTIVSGTAFAVSAAGDMITNHHVVAGENRDQRARQIGVTFADSPQFFRADLVRTSDSGGADLALIRVRLGSAVPFIARLNRRPDTIPVGAPAAIIGFPLGDELPMQQTEAGTLASTTLSAAIISKNIPGDVQLEGFGAPGGSGSPVFDANGEVIGVVYGGIPTLRLVFGVRSDDLIRFLNRN